MRRVDENSDCVSAVVPLETDLDIAALFLRKKCWSESKKPLLITTPERTMNSPN